MTRDKSTGLSALFLGIAVVAATTQLPESTIRNDIGPKIFPYLTGALLIGCGGLLALFGGKKIPAYFSPAELARFIRISAVVVAYCVAMYVIGYFVPTVLALFVLCTMFSADAPVPSWKRAAFALLVAAAIYLLFTRLLVMKLPVGVWL